jgi:CHAD domain-containing protein
MVQTPKHLSRISKAVEKISREHRKTTARSARQAAQELAQRRFDRVLKRLSKARLSDWASLHRVRVALKQFRYAAETANALADRPRAHALKSVRSMQSGMGRIQDLHVLTSHLKQWAPRDGTRTPGIQQALDGLRQERRQAVAEFAAYSREIAGAAV